MKLFLAIDLAPQKKQLLYHKIEEFRHSYKDFNWVLPSHYHISLFFFGDRYTVDYLKSTIDKVVFDVDVFHLYSADIRMFVRDSITVYLGFHKNKPIEDLVKKLKIELQIQNDLTFFPHLTLAKYRLPSKQQYLLIKKKCSQYDLDIDFEVTQITLFDSVIENKKPIYRKVAEFPLLTDH